MPGMSSFISGKAVANRSDFLRHLKKLRRRVSALGLGVLGFMVWGLAMLRIGDFGGIELIGRLDIIGRIELIGPFVGPKAAWDESGPSFLFGWKPWCSFR